MGKRGPRLTTPQCPDCGKRPARWGDPGCYRCGCKQYQAVEGELKPVVRRGYKKRQTETVTQFIEPMTANEFESQVG